MEQVWFVRIFQEKKPHLNLALCGILGVSFIFTFYEADKNKAAEGKGSSLGF